MSKIFKYLAITGGIGIAVFFAVPASREIVVSKGVSWLMHDREPMTARIREGIAFLRASPPLEYVEGVKQQVALAILDRTTGRIHEERLWITHDGTIIEQPSERHTVAVTWWNSYNSVFEIKDHPEQIVVANKFRVERRYLPEQQVLKLDVGAPRGTHADIVFVPYSISIHVPTVVAAGKQYLNEKTQQAFSELRRDRVASRAVPGALIADVVSRDLVRTVILLEHVDPGWLMLADDGGRTLAERTLVIIGANREWAYRYTNSRAGANGIAQFIEPTYQVILGRYPDANLIQDRTLGMADHVNAFKAIAVLFDNEMREIQEKTGSMVTPAMLVAAYNGGPNRVIKAVNASGPAWEESAIFPDETSNYIKKYHLIEKLKIF